MSDPERSEGGEPTEGGERTRESEIKANVEFWKDLGVEVDEADVKAKIEELPEVEGFDWYLYIPDNIVGLKPWNITRKMFNIQPDSTKNPDWEDEIDDVPRCKKKESYAIACRHQQEPDEDSLGENAKSAFDWEIKDRGDFITARERIVAGLSWFKDSGTHLDKKNKTICPNSRSSHGGVPRFYFNGVRPDCGGYRLNDLPRNHVDSRWGIRRVITKDTKV